MGIKFDNVSFEYPTVNEKVFAIKDINLSIKPEGELIAIVGHTGSGKSTMIQHMNALLLPSNGDVDVFGHKVVKGEKLTPIRKRVGMVFQFPEYQLFEETVEKDIMFGPLNFGLTKEEAKEKAEEVINIVGLDESFLARSPFNLSGGQMRRVAIAGILAMEPDILILDEPTVGLDPQGQIEMMELFLSIHEKYNKTVILVTHNMDVVSEYANRVIVMKKARLVFDGSPVDLFGNEKLVRDYDLDLPKYMKIMKVLNDKFDSKLDETVFNLEDLVTELKKL
ncbi:energy-coupling factor transporter ATPase [Mycoplasmatota bacterium zrk1]